MKRRSFLFIFMVFGFICLAGIYASAYAQDIATPDTVENDVDMSAVPDEYLEESMKFYDDCSVDQNLLQYYDCKCLSVAYLDKRIELGPLEPQQTIKLALAGKCKDATGAAGPVYQQCLNKASSFEPGTDPEKFCACVANNYVRIVSMNENVTVDSRKIIQYQTQAYVTCRNPDLARRLFQYQPQ